VLQPIGQDTLASNAAELSRPYRLFKEAARRANNKTRGRKHKHNHVAATLMNWMVPPIWAHILVAGRAVGLNMSPIAIEHYLKVHNPSQFAMITAQVIGRWIECPAHGLPCWTDKVLARMEAAAGYTLAGHVTRSGVLVYRHDSITCSHLTHL
jgi:hypothetical protein